MTPEREAELREYAEDLRPVAAKGAAAAAAVAVLDLFAALDATRMALNVARAGVAHMSAATKTLLRERDVARSQLAHAEADAEQAIHSTEHELATLRNELAVLRHERGEAQGEAAMWRSAYRDVCEALSTTDWAEGIGDASLASSSDVAEFARACLRSHRSIADPKEEHTDE